MNRDEYETLQPKAIIATIIITLTIIIIIGSTTEKPPPDPWKIKVCTDNHMEYDQDKGTYFTCTTKIWHWEYENIKLSQKAGLKTNLCYDGKP